MATRADRPRIPLRWHLAEEDDEGTLFPDETAVTRHVGTGEFRGMEFLHVNARSIINPVPAASRMSFRYTINPYRGCSHACSYCLGGDTPILMGDGTTKLMVDVRKGDLVYGTVRRGDYRRYAVTEVLDHWSTIKPAYRTTLDDGTQLVTSGDHRFLSGRGWKHVTGTGYAVEQRPHLGTGDELLAVDVATVRERSIEGDPVEPTRRVGVVSVEPLGVELPLYDMTTGTGDFVSDGVISHNCFARPTHDYLGLNIGEDFERRIVVKVNTVERLRAELRAPNVGRRAHRHGDQHRPLPARRGQVPPDPGRRPDAGRGPQPVQHPDQVDAGPARPRPPGGGGRADVGARSTFDRHARPRRLAS